MERHDCLACGMCGFTAQFVGFRGVEGSDSDYSGWILLSFGFATQILLTSGFRR